MITANGQQSDFLTKGFMVLPAPNPETNLIDFDHVHSVTSGIAQLYSSLLGTATQKIVLTSESPDGYFFDMRQFNGFVRIGMSSSIIPLLIEGDEGLYGKFHDLSMAHIGHSISDSYLPHGVSRDSYVRLLTSLREPARVMRDLLFGIGITQDDLDLTNEINCRSSLYVALACSKKDARVNGLDEDHRDAFNNGVVALQQSSPRVTKAQLGATRDTLQTVMQHQGETFLMNCFPKGVGAVQRAIHNFFVPECEDLGPEDVVRSTFLCAIEGPLARDYMARQQVIVPVAPRVARGFTLRL
ncbi:MAG TPA: hypothetical protein PKB15_05765 [Acidimicrobiia bacterium]|nr:hypothetical protein [Acidimicrobiia bacterium]